MIFEIGKLYKCSSHYLLIYPTKEDAEATPVPRTRIAEKVLVTAVSSSPQKHLNLNVRFSQLNEPFMVLKEPEKINNIQYINVLFGDKMGWIIYNEWIFCNNEWNWIKIERII